MAGDTYSKQPQDALQLLPSAAAHWPPDQEGNRRESRCSRFAITCKASWSNRRTLRWITFSRQPVI